MRSIAVCRPKRFILLTCALPLLGMLAAGVPAMGAGPDAKARAEIAHLLDHLEQSGCEFYRNGEWRSAKDAREHLATKYEYLLKKGWVRTAEDFIARAGSESSVSGKPYQVRCAGSRPVPSAEWLRSELRRYRSSR